MMKIVLINPPFIITKKKAFSFQCLGLLYIASFLRIKGHEIKIIDAFSLGNNNFKNINKEYYKAGLDNNKIIKRIEPDVDLIGISVPFSHLARIVHELVFDIKAFIPKVPVVLGGVYPSTQPELAIKSNADFIVMGDGEETILNIADYISGKTNQLLNGIITSNSDNENPKSHFTNDINILPFPARDLLPAHVTQI